MGLNIFLHYDGNLTREEITTAYFTLICSFIWLTGAVIETGCYCVLA